ncbi:alpha/beta hydrolase [Streptococcus hongkongensis]|nr:alpha/beta hydrolase [Streptococcus uberis]
MKLIRLSKYFAVLIIFAFLISVAASFYFFHVAQVREEKTFINNRPRSSANPLHHSEKAFDQLNVKKRWMTNRGKKQVAFYLPAAKKTNKTVIVVHGFTTNKENMKPYAMLFHDLGYNVLVPDNESHGESQGELIGYGWNDRKNVIAWSESLIKENQESQITLFGLSMGAATVMMASGDPLPSQIHQIIEDCGYSSVWEELKFQAKEMYGLPAFPLLYEVSALSKLRAGFTYGEASAVKQLQKNKLPILFIHGSKDDFVPTRMVYDLYKATKGPKDLLIIKGAKHARAYETDMVKYKEKVSNFLKENE